MCMASLLVKNHGKRLMVSGIGASSGITASLWTARSIDVSRKGGSESRQRAGGARGPRRVKSDASDCGPVRAVLRGGRVQDLGRGQQTRDRLEARGMNTLPTAPVSVGTSKTWHCARMSTGISTVLKLDLVVPGQGRDLGAVRRRDAQREHLSQVSSPVCSHQDADPDVAEARL